MAIPAGDDLLGICTASFSILAKVVQSTHMRDAFGYRSPSPLEAWDDQQVGQSLKVSFIDFVSTAGADEGPAPRPSN